MPMLDIAKRHMDVWRIRIGDKDESGKPRKLTDSIRVTSPNRSVVNAFAAVFGGEPREWDSEWEVYVPGSSLPVLVLPGQSISQWWEKYTGGVCERRCDGYTETKSGKPCVCPANIEERLTDKKKWCQPMTRINVVCTDVEVVGAGSLVTHSMVAAETLPQAVAIAEQALSHGLMVPAVLRVVEHVGKGKRYIVPQLEIVGISLTQLQTGEVPRAAISARPNLELAPPADDGETKVVDEDAARRDRELQTEKSRLHSLTMSVADDKKGLLRKAWREAGLPERDPVWSLTEENIAEGRNLIHQWVALSALAAAGFTTEKQRHQAVKDATAGETESTKGLSVDQLRDVIEFCDAIRSTSNDPGPAAA